MYIPHVQLAINNKSRNIHEKDSVTAKEENKVPSPDELVLVAFI